MVKAKKSHRISKGQGGGRPRQEGERYPNGRLKPRGPNERSVEIRQALGLKKLNQRMVPLDVAHANGWLSSVDYLTGIRFANLHQAAGFAHSGGSMGATMEVDIGTEVSLSVSMDAKSFFSGLPHAELVVLWDRVFDRGERDPVKADEASAKAMRQWKAACAAMTMQERAEVTNVCVLDSFPQWIIQRSAGREGTSWEGKRDLLISGLAKVRQSLRPQRDPAPELTDYARPVNRAPSRAQVERTVYVDEEGKPVREDVRIRRPDA